MSESGINFAWNREYFIRARLCVCDQTRGDSCRLCDGTAADEAELRGYQPRPRERSAAA
jgi:hypothetical protein